MKKLQNSIIGIIIILIVILFIFITLTVININNKTFELVKETKKQNVLIENQNKLLKEALEKKRIVIYHWRSDNPLPFMSNNYTIIK